MGSKCLWITSKEYYILCSFLTCDVQSVLMNNQNHNEMKKALGDTQTLRARWL